MRKLQFQEKMKRCGEKKMPYLGFTKEDHLMVKRKDNDIHIEAR